LVTCCIKGCWLHLHLAQTELYLLEFSTVESVNGIIVAVGNVGQFLSYETVDSSTFISTDGGVSWSQLWPQPTIFAVGNNGGIILFTSTIPSYSEAVPLYYTIDLGATVQTLYIPSIDAETNILAGSLASLFFLVNGGQSNFLLGIDFTTDFTVACNLTTDYDLWTPTDPSGTAGCYLGASTTYLRKKNGVNCINNITNFVASQKPCPCIFADYECAPGYLPTLRNATNGFTCTPTYGSPYSCGYQLVPNTLCVGGLDLSGCTTATTTSSTVTTGTTSYTLTTSSSGNTSGISTTGNTSFFTTSYSTAHAVATSSSLMPTIGSTSSSSNVRHKVVIGEIVVGFHILFSLVGVISTFLITYY